MSQSNGRLFGLVLVAIICLAYSVSAQWYPREREKDASKCSVNETFAKGWEYYCRTEMALLVGRGTVDAHLVDEEACMCKEGYCYADGGKEEDICVNTPIMHCRQERVSTCKTRLKWICKEYNPWTTKRPIEPTRSPEDPDYDYLPTEEPAKYRFVTGVDVDAEDYLD